MSSYRQFAGEKVAKTQAYVTPEAGLTVESREVDLPPCGQTDVVVEIIASGLCRTDLDFIKNIFGLSQFPLVAGHEGVGRIVEMGEKVTSRRIGQLVGLGWMRDSCQTCRVCTAAKENTCSQMKTKLSFFQQQGTFAEFCVSPAKFACPIPAGLDPIAAAPLMCAGVTVYSVLAERATHVSKVLVVSMGGLGSLGVQFAAKMGCEVVSMSRGAGKKAQALGFGAHSHIDSTDAEQVKAFANHFDLILDTSPVTADMGVMVSLLGAAGKYVTVGVPEDGKQMQVGALGLLFGNKGVAGSQYGTLSQVEDMMIFAARHKIVADCETLPFSQLAEAMQRLDEGKNEKMRIVLLRVGKLEKDGVPSS